MMKKTETESSSLASTDTIVADDVSLVSPTNQAIYEAGKAMLIDSISTGREFCKFMIGTAMSAIPIYLALLKFVLPEKYVPSLNVGIIALIPAVIFLIAGIVFLVGYFPHTSITTLDLPDEIENERQRTVTWRYNLGIAGFSVFCLAIVTGIIITYYMLRLPNDKKPDVRNNKLTEQLHSPDGKKRGGATR